MTTFRLPNPTGRGPTRVIDLRTASDHVKLREWEDQAQAFQRTLPWPTRVATVTLPWLFARGRHFVSVDVDKIEQEGLLQRLDLTSTLPFPFAMSPHILSALLEKNERMMRDGDGIAFFHEPSGHPCFLGDKWALTPPLTDCRRTKSQVLDLVLGQIAVDTGHWIAGQFSVSA